MGGLSNPSGVKSVQRGIVWTGTRTAGAAPEISYLDITIAAVNASKTRVNLMAMMGVGASGVAADSVAQTNDRYQTAANTAGEVFGYVINTTTLRLYSGITGAAHRWNGRYEVIEDN